MKSIPHPLELISLIEYRHEANRPFFPSWFVQPYHEAVEVVTGGRGWVKAHGDWHEVGPGDLLWHSPGDQPIAQSDPDDPFRCLYAHFRVTRAKGAGLPRFSKWPDIAEIQLLSKECIRLLWNPAFDRTALCDYLYAKLLFQVQTYELSLKQTRYPDPVAAVLARIGNHTHRTVERIEDLAKEAGWSVSHLQAEFLKHVGMTPRQLLIQKRLQAVKERLVTTTEPIKQIAIENGFYDLSALSHAFKVHTGMTPSEFRGCQGRKGKKIDDGEANP